MSAIAIYYNPNKPAASSSLNKLSAALSPKNKSDVTAWLEQQEAYTKHRAVRERFLGNPCTMSKPHGRMGMQSDGSTVPRKIQCYAQIHYICNRRFSKYLHLIHVKTKIGHPSPLRFDPYFTTITRADLCGYVQTRTKNSK